MYEKMLSLLHNTFAQNSTLINIKTHVEVYTKTVYCFKYGATGIAGEKWNKKSENVQCFSCFFLLQKQHEGSECQKHDTAENEGENTVLNYQNNLSIYKMEKKKKKV